MRIKQVLDLEQLVDVAPRVDALAFARLLRTDRAKLGFPVTQNIGLHVQQVRDLTDHIGTDLDLFEFSDIETN